ncbi:MAG: DUF4412 domain-containing protein [Verrucomicrobiota bacterium]|nr:DUF4412 domain-containing protein [Verrucomicrobiota bacterium]
MSASGLADAAGFEGKIEIAIVEGDRTTSLRYTNSADSLRIEVIGNDLPNPVDIIDQKSGTLTILFPQNHSFLRLKPTNASAPTEARPVFPNPGGGMPAIPPVSMPAIEKSDLKAIGKKEKILGYACELYEIQQRGETMEIWATGSLIPFHSYRRNQERHFGPRLLEERWPDLLAAKNLFPLRATLRSENNAESYRFEVKAITPEKANDSEKRLFRPPADYIEIPALPFPGR